MLNVKLCLHTAIVISTTIYACETWKRTAMFTHSLDIFHRCGLRTIIGISWHSHVTNEEVMRRAGTERLQDIVGTRRRKMAGHVLRLQRDRLAHTALYWVPENGRRNRGRPKKTWQSRLRRPGKDGCQLARTQRISNDHAGWRLLVA